MSFQCGGMIAGQQLSEAESAIMAAGVFSLFIVCPSLGLSALGLIAAHDIVNAELGKAYLTKKDNIEDEIDWTQDLYDQYQEEFLKNKAMFSNKPSFLQTEFPKKIEERINELINQKYTNENKESFEIFSTPQSKIFVLQNIEDFFKFN